jgi:hypothetical protein
VEQILKTAGSPKAPASATLMLDKTKRFRKFFIARLVSLGASCFRYQQ